jgi:hypothetical protein
MCKGQIPIFESVLLFTIGVAIFVMCFAIFTIYQATWTEQAESQQLEQIGFYISAAIQMLTENPANVSQTISIPKQVGNSFYDIIVDDGKLNLTTERISHIFQLNKNFQFSGKKNSIAGQILLKKDGNKIFIV